MSEVEKLKAQNKLLQAQIKDKEMEIALLKKIERVGRVECLSLVRQENKYLAVQYIHQKHGYPVKRLCRSIQLNRSSYYKWLKRNKSKSEIVNEQLVKWIKDLYEEQNGILGYRQMTITINREKNVHYNQKRIRRLMKILHLQSVCRNLNCQVKCNTLETIPKIV